MKSFVVFVVFCVCGVLPFNLENRNPIIKRGEVGSYFGYSVAQHKFYNNNKYHNRVEDNWLLIGAPLGQNLQPNTNRSGALFKCPISYFDDDCVQVKTDGRRSEDSPELFPPRAEEIKDNQWLGVTVRSQGAGGMVLVCAHRYISIKKGSHFGQGLCYTLNSTLDYDNAYEPCKGRNVEQEHKQYGYCQCGTGGALMPDGMAIIGSPGPFTWRGTVFVQQVAGAFFDRDNTVYMGPLNNSPKPVDKYSYLGMSVAGGKFLGKDMLYAGGAPRANETGQVFIFYKEKQTPVMNLTMTLDGEQFASSFGYEVAATDINNDGKTDLIVGAPFYFTRNEGGAVYVYMDLRCLSKCAPTQKLTGKLESRFGFAIAGIGDINKDGYNDVAVGAPYEEDGAVYIYLGAQNGLIEEPSQVLRPMKTGITTLGYSLSGSQDMDENLYPDLLVGAYDSDVAVLYLGRVIINITTEIRGNGLENIDPTRQKCLKDPNSNSTCFTFEACSTLSLNGVQKLDQTLEYMIEAETFTGERKFSRVYFKRNNVQTQVIKDSFKIVNNNRTYCTKETVYLKENTRDILSPIKFRLNYTLGNDNPLSAMLNKTGSQTIFMATFQKDCGDNDICESKLVLDAKLILEEEAENQYVLMLGEKDELQVDVNVTNYGEPAYETQLYVKHPSSLSYIAIGEKTGNIVCNYKNDALVICSLGNPFKHGSQAKVLLRFEPKNLDKSHEKLQFNIKVNSTSKELSHKTKAVLSASIVKHAEVGITGAATSNIFYGGEVKGESAMKYLDDIGSRVVHTYQVVNTGPWKIDYLEVHIEWPFQVANNKPLGKWLLYLEEKPIIDGGEYCQMGKDMVNPLGLLIRPGSQDFPMENDEISSYTDLPYNRTTRRKRDIEKILRSETHIDSDGHKREVVNMNCQNGTAKCIKFHCIIKNLQRSGEATIKIRARLWNSTLIEDYPRIDWVRIVSSAKIHIPPEFKIEQNTTNDEATAVTLAYPDLLDQQEVEPAPLWIIIVAVAGGLLLLILLTLLLWKLGFFKRQRLDPTLSGNLEKHREETPFLS